MDKIQKEEDYAQKRGKLDKNKQSKSLIVSKLKAHFDITADEEKQGPKN